VDVAGGGYLNFHLDRGAFALALARSIAQRESGGFPGRRRPAKSSSSIPISIPIKQLISATCAIHLGDSFVRCLRFLGHEVEVQNYLDNTGVQVADVVVGLERMQAMTLPDVAAIDGKFDYYCWDVYARVSEFYQQSEENRQVRSLTSASRGSGQ